MAIILAVNAVSLYAYHRMNVNSEGKELVEQKRPTLSDFINQKGHLRFPLSRFLHLPVPDIAFTSSLVSPYKSQPKRVSQLTV